MTTIKFAKDMNDWDADYYFMGRLPYANVSMGAIGIAETEPDYARTLLGFQKVTERVGRFRQRLLPQPLDVNPPEWAYDEDFDIDRHVPHVKLPDGSTERDLFRLADDILAAPFEDGRPPWSFTFVTGLAGGRSASILKLHHCLSDGTALTALFGSMAAARDREASGLSFETDSAEAGTLRRVASASIRRLPRIAAQGWDGIRRLAHESDRAALARAMRETIANPPGRGRPDRKRRAVAFAVPLEDWKEAARSRGGGVNELYLALAARLSLETRRATTPSVCVAMPVNLREGDDQSGGNTIGVGKVVLSADADPLDDLALVRERAGEARKAAQGQGPTLLDCAVRALPGRVRGGLAFRRSRWPDVSATNLVSPTPFEIGDARMSHAYVVAPAIGSPLSMALFTYMGNVHVTVNADLGLVEGIGTTGDAAAKVLAELGLAIPVIGGDP